VLAGGAVEIQIARLRFAPRTDFLDSVEGAALIAGYERRNRLVAPLIRLLISRLADFRYDGSETARRRVARALPLVAFSPLG
jgi:hypothetical protein